MNALTDLYNAVSVQHLVPIGGEDLDGYDGPPRLVVADGTETLDTVAAGESAVQHADAGESEPERDGLGRLPSTVRRTAVGSLLVTEVGTRPHSVVGRRLGVGGVARGRGSEGDSNADEPAERGAGREGPRHRPPVDGSSEPPDRLG